MTQEVAALRSGEFLLSMSDFKPGECIRKRCGFCRALPNADQVFRQFAQNPLKLAIHGFFE